MSVIVSILAVRYVCVTSGVCNGVTHQVAIRNDDMPYAHIAIAVEVWLCMSLVTNACIDDTNHTIV